MNEKKRILVVEDDASLSQIFTDKLDSEGFDSFSAKDGEEGLQMAISKRPDFILLDLMMPKMNGLEVLEKLRALDEWGKNIPVVIITNIDPDENMVRAIAKTKPFFFLAKGLFDLDELVKKVREGIRN